MLALEIKRREAKESTETLRKRGVMPGVLYGPKEKSTAIAIDALKFDRLWREAGETTVVTLKGIGDAKETLIHDVQFHPVTSVPLHVDFYVLEKGKKIKIKVPLTFTGVAPAEKAGHIVVKTLHEVEIEVAPAELPHNLPVDISALSNVGERITAGQIKLPTSATLLTHASEIVASVTEFREEKVEIPVVPAEAVEGAPAEGEAILGSAAGEPVGVPAESKQETKKEGKKKGA